MSGSNKRATGLEGPGLGGGGNELKRVCQVGARCSFAVQVNGALYIGSIRS
ncbi:hypothetical protein QFZ86_003243 [Pseudomonas plecoglossicida]